MWLWVVIQTTIFFISSEYLGFLKITLKKSKKQSLFLSFHEKEKKQKKAALPKMGF